MRGRSSRPQDRAHMQWLCMSRNKGQPFVLVGSIKYYVLSFSSDPCSAHWRLWGVSEARGSILDIIKKVGKVAYKLQLPTSSQIHPVFHVSQLKKYKGPTPMVLGQLPTLSTKGLIIEEPFVVLDRRMAKKGNVAAVYVLIQWVNGTPSDATWELYKDIAARFPSFDLN
ncbi:reverse transcriptase [Tanacetum coccineum]